ncbi:PadR family transcriptional regulator [Actinomadura bangladeshensis]|uniref:PadR family transcriptional regulator n=1 Tax=Actinomadura bangladeshensis TaxID=453573 RepID=A0A4R4P3R1_9ACTN|nr:PadR family transcriptional regulator [Actinomadura bangladeshensis]TDC15277.1 PadR family transcriptional regulator [Actinomadura bangladeshensis]
MSLRHAVLGLLAELGGASGYDLLKLFEVSLDNVWPATQSQLYGELGKLTDAGLIEVAAEGPRGRREYRITPSGRAELHHWLIGIAPKPNRRDETLLRVFFLGELTRAEARRYIDEQIDAIGAQAAGLAEVEKAVEWDEQGGMADNGRFVLEYGKRFFEMRRDWLRWVAAELAARDSRSPGDSPED